MIVFPIRGESGNAKLIVAKRITVPKRSLISIISLITSNNTVIYFSRSSAVL